MIEPQPITVIERSTLVPEVAKLKSEGYHLVQICCTQIPAGLEVTYSFDREYKLVNLRVVVALDDAKLPSLTGIFFAAFTYENELQDLFGIKVEGLALDFKGKFYRKAQETPFLKPVTPPTQG